MSGKSSASSVVNNTAFTAAGAGAVVRVVQDKLREWVSVLDFGAKGDGVTDDTAALNAAAAAAAGKALLHVPAGTYMVDGTNNSIASGPTSGGWVLPSDTHVIMAAGAAITVKTNALAGYTAILIADADNVTIRGGQVIGDRLNHTYNNVFDTLANLNAGVYRTKTINDGTNLFADGQTAYVTADGGNNGTYLKTAGVWNKTSGALPNYYTHEFGFGVEVVGSTNVLIEGVVMKNFTGDGAIVLNRSTAQQAMNVRFEGCTFDSNRRQGISFITGKALQARGSFFSNIGVRLNNQDGTAPRAGIDIEAGTVTKCDGVLVSNNVFRGCTIGVSQFDGNNVTISGNQIDGATGGGISWGSGVNTAIVGNSLNGCGMGSVGARSTVASTYSYAGGVVTLNTGAVAHGYVVGDVAYIELQDANGMPALAGVYSIATVPDAFDITFAIAAGVPLANGNATLKYTANNVTVADNTIQSGQINAHGKLLNITGNAVWNGGQYGIYLNGDCVDVSVSRNVLNNCATSITVVAGASDVKIDGNQIYGASLYAVNSNGTKTQISFNKIRYCKAGITAGGGSNVIQANYIDIGDYPAVSAAILTSTVAADVIDNQIEAHPGTACLSQAKARYINNKITNHTGLLGIQITGAASDGSTCIGNLVEFNRATTATSIGITISNNTKARVIRNVICGINAAPLRGIDTSASATSTLTNNVYQGALNTAAGDTLNSNVAY